MAEDWNPTDDELQTIAKRQWHINPWISDLARLVLRERENGAYWRGKANHIERRLVNAEAALARAEAERDRFQRDAELNGREMYQLYRKVYDESVQARAALTRVEALCEGDLRGDYAAVLAAKIRAAIAGERP